MKINSPQHIVDLINGMSANTWIILLLGIAYIIALEHVAIRSFLHSKKRDKKLLCPVWNRAKYMVLGLLVFLCSWTIITWISSLIPLRSVNLMGIESKGVWANLKHWTGFSALISTLGLHLSGWTLMLSAGGRWMVNLAKLLATLSVFYLIFMGLIAVV